MAALKRTELMEEELDQVSAGLELDIMKVYELASNYGSAEDALRAVRDHVGSTVLNKIKDNWETIDQSEKIPDQVKHMVAHFVL